MININFCISDFEVVKLVIATQMSFSESSSADDMKNLAKRNKTTKSLKETFQKNHA